MSLASLNRLLTNVRRGQVLTRVTIGIAILLLTPSAATAQSTWLPTSGTFSWLSSGSWSNSSVPNATGAVAVFPTSGVGASVLSGTVTTGTVSVTAGSGNVVLQGLNGAANDVITLATASGSPTINVNTGASLYWYTDLAGTQGYTKTGGGMLIFQYNSDNHTYTGTTNLGGGTVRINQDGSLGNVNNPILVSANSALQVLNGVSSGTITLASTRTTTINSGITFTLQNGAGMATVVNGPITGSGNLTLNTGSISLNGANTYSGNTIIRSATVTLGSSSPLSSAALTLNSAGDAANQLSTLVDFGGRSQSVSSLTTTIGGTNQVTNTFRNGSLAVTGGSLTVNSGASTAVTGTTTLDLRGLSSFSYNNSAGTFAIFTSGTLASGTFGTVVSTATTNTITAAHVQIGNSANGPTVSRSTLGLGQTNTYNTGTLTVGGYRGDGTMSYLAGVTGGTLVLRGTAGGSSRVDNVYVGFKSGGDNFGNGVLDVSAGSIDARVDSFAVGRYFANASNAHTGTFTMSSGTVDATTLGLGVVLISTGSVGNPAITSVVNQSGGLVKASTVVFGSNGATFGTNSPSFTSTYNLTGGTLAAAAIVTGGGTFAAGSNRSIAWTGGTVTNYDASTDLSVDGVSGTGGRLTISLGGIGTKTLAADAGRTITIGANALVSSTGGLTVNGAGTIVINGSNTYSGGTTLSAGTLRAGNANAFGSGGVTVASGATLDLNSLAVANAITNNGGTVSNAASYAGSQTVSGAATIGNLGGTLVVANGGAATFGGTLAAATTINAGGNGTLNNAGSITAAGLTNNGTFTIDRTGSSSLATVFSGNGTLVKAGAGIVSLSGSSSFSGATQVNAGDLRVDGSLAGGVSVASTGILGGSGIVGAISGAGMIGPGNSPGILTSTGSLDPSGGADFSFELTGTAPTWSAATTSLNDVLHLTAATPMTAALSGSNGNVINVYLNAGSLTAGSTFLGGIFIDQPQGTLDLAPLVSGATFAYFVAGGSDVTYNGVGYSTLANYVTANPAITGVTASTVTVASADFATGTVTNGQVMQFAIVPEPGAMVLVATGVLAAGWTTIRRVRCRRG